MRKKWTSQMYNKLCQDVKIDCKNEGIGDECMNDIAESILCENDGLKEFIINELHAEDYQGRLANDI